MYKALSTFPSLLYYTKKLILCINDIEREGTCWNISVETGTEEEIIKI